MKKENTPGPWGITSFSLHLLAMGLMLCDHMWGTFSWNLPWLGYLGRLAFPIFAFLMAEGFRHTADRKKYARRIFAFALLSELPFDLMMERTAFNPFHQNVLWTFLISLGVLSLYEKIKTRRSLPVRLGLYALVTLGGYVLGFLTFADYFGYGVLTVSLFYFTRTDAAAPLWKRVALGLLQLGGLYWINCRMMKGMMIPLSVFGMGFEVYKQGFALLALPLIFLYRGQQGLYNKSVRRLYYWFYPVHMLILGLIMKLL